MAPDVFGYAPDVWIPFAFMIAFLGLGWASHVVWLSWRKS